jgi:hypothetical protein
MIEIFIFLLIVIGACGFILLILGKNKNKKDGEHYLDRINSLDVTNEEFFKVLNFLLLYGIITFEEYQVIEQKGLSYTR